MSTHTAETLEQEIQETRRDIEENVNELESTRENIEGRVVVNTLLRYGKKTALKEVERLGQKAGTQIVRSSQTMADRSKQYPLLLAGLGLLAGFLLTSNSNNERTKS